MRIFVAGATGALGVPVVRQLTSDGHTVIGLAKTKQRTSRIESLGAKAVIGDALDAESLRKSVAAARPDAVVHALTAIPDRGPMRAFDLDATTAYAQPEQEICWPRQLKSGHAVLLPSQWCSFTGSEIWEIKS
jgi:nucleoside-diphosphate-sugar epimerase